MEIRQLIVASYANLAVQTVQQALIASNVLIVHITLINQPLFVSYAALLA